MSTEKITALGFNFDATKVAPAQPMEAVPAGWYSVAISDAELKLTEGGNGRRLAVEWTITEGQYKGRKIFDGFNIIHSNAQAQQIAAGHLSAICHAIQVFQVADASQLLNKPHQIKVSVEPERWVDSDNNEVAPNTPNAKKYEAKNAFKGAKAGSAPAAPVATNAPGAAAPAWAAPAASAPTPAPAAAAPVAPPPWAATGAAPGNAPAAQAPANAGTPTPTTAPTPPAAPSAPSAGGKPAGKPGKKPGGKPAAAPKVERKFFVGVDAPEFAEALPESKVSEYFAKGMPADTPLCLEGESEYKTAAEYGVATGPTAAPAPAAPQTPAPAPAPTPAPAPAAATPAGALPPWAR